MLRDLSLMPEEQTADFIGGGIHVENHTYAFLFPASGLLQLQHNGGGKITVPLVFRLVIFPDIDHASQVFQQASVRIIRSRLIKKAPSVGIGIEHNLHGVNDGGFAAS